MLTGGTAPPQGFSAGQFPGHVPGQGLLATPPMFGSMMHPPPHMPPHMHGPPPGPMGYGKLRTNITFSNFAYFCADSFL